VPQEFRAEGGLVEFYGGVSVTDRQHGRDLSDGSCPPKRSPQNASATNPIR
jgi:hypothetical protein